MFTDASPFGDPMSIETSALASAPLPLPLADTYLPAAGSFDEMRTAQGDLRPHWEYLLGAIHALGSSGVEERRREARRLMRDNGVTYNVYGDPQGFGRPWNLDLIPLLIRSDEWAVIERGLMQRAELLNQILLDLHGPRGLIRKGLLPADLIDGYPGYLLPCHGIRIAGERPLIYYAADLIRAADGPGASLGTAPRTPLAQAMRWRTASSFPMFCRACSGTLTSTAWRASSAPCAAP